MPDFLPIDVVQNSISSEENWPDSTLCSSVYFRSREMHLRAFVSLSTKRGDSCIIPCSVVWRRSVPPKGKKAWEKPALKAFANAEEAIAYYSTNGKPDDVAAIQRMRTDFETQRKKAEKPGDAKR